MNRGEDDRLEGARLPSDLNFHLLTRPQGSFASSGFLIIITAAMNNTNSSKHLGGLAQYFARLHLFNPHQNPKR